MLNDKDTIRAVLDGNMEAYSNIIDKYKNMIFDLCYRYTYDMNESQDLSQEIFIKVYRKLHTFNNSSSFTTWLYRVSINTCIDWSRKNKKLKNVGSIDEEGYAEYLPSQDKMPEDMVIEREKRQIIRNAVLNLPEKYRTVVVLYNYKGLNSSEIARILGIPVKTVETRLYRAKNMLKDKLLKPYNGGEYAWNAVK